MIKISEVLLETRGLKSRLARELGVTYSAVSQWRVVPALRVIEVERVTGISRHVLRPDIYPLPATSRGGGEPGAGEGGLVTSPAPGHPSKEMK